ncbi:MAG TPA: ATP-binding protein [Micromonosporaceae bacterium]|nr:ATP-binding protein [Micromonosporaceae bacterium]
MRRLHIEAKDDHVLRLAHRDQPVTAIIELVWNSLDAEAHNVNVVVERDAMDAVERVRVEDDGHGIAPEAVRSAFEHLGGSWKAAAKVSPNLKRRMNGSKGQGRIRGFALGNAISWLTVARDTAGVLRRTVVSGRASDPTNFDPTETPVAGDERTGTCFVAEDPAKYVNRITADGARPRITATFALFLTSHPDVRIRFDGADLDPVSAEEHRADYPMTDFAKGVQDPPLLRIIEWSTDPGRAIHLCELSGSVLETISPDIHTPGFNYTAYVMWEEFGRRSNELPLTELRAGEFGEVIAAVREQIKAHFRAREAQRRAEQVQKWKDEGDYPYDGESQTEAERAERETFDYVATTVARKISKSQIGRRTTLGLLKVALANEPSSVPQILDQLMPLPRREQEDLARLLVRTPISKLIEANTMLTNRLDFLAILRDMVFDPVTSSLVKERKELHKILEKELWVFGDEYLLLTSDRGLDEVLARHLATLRPDQVGKSRKGGPAVRRSDGSRGIVDLMLSQQRRGVARREHLIVELKRPSVTITQAEVGQIKSYADAVADDAQFHGINIHWDFWVISSKLDSTVNRDANQPNLPPGQVAGWDNIRIWAKTWSQIIDDCETRLRYFKDALEYDASKEHAADYINRAYDGETVPAPLRAP